MRSLEHLVSPLARLGLAPLALVLLFAAPTPALALGDWIGVEGSLWRQDQDGNASINGDILPGTSFDFQDTLGLEKTDDTLTGRVWFRFGRFRMLFDYFDSTRTGGKTLTQSFLFDDTPYLAGQTVKSDFDLKLMQGQFLFSVVDLKVVDWGLGFGVHEAQVDLELDNGLPGGQSTLDESIPYPTASTYVTIKPIPTLHFKGELNGVRGTVSGIHVDTLDYRFQVEWYVAHVLGFFAGYRQLRFDVDDEDFGTVENTFKGPYAGLGLKF